MQSLIMGGKELSSDRHDPDFQEFHNNFVEKCQEKGCGYTTMETQIKQLRKFLRQYLESMNKNE